MTKPEHLRPVPGPGGLCHPAGTGGARAGFVYTVFSVEYTGEQRELSSLESFVGGVRKGDSPDTSAYLERVAANLTERAEGLEKSSGREAEAAEYRR